MVSVEQFEHTADVGLRIKAETLNGLFQGAAEGLLDLIVVNRDQVQEKDLETARLEAESAGDLLIAWLNELIFRFETTHRLYRRISVEVRVSDYDRPTLVATLCGEPLDPDRHLLDHEVKAATQHGEVLRKDPDGWSAEVILDI